MTTFPCPGPCRGRTTVRARLCTECAAAVSSLTPRPPLAPEDVSRPGGRRHWTAEDRRDMVARYEKGAGTPQIAAAYSVTAETVMKVLRAEGVTIRPRAGSAVA